jgi:dTDP-4-amino-4,6-dideoxygalactose transaminase
MSSLKMVDLHRQYLALKTQIDGAIAEVLDTTAFIQGQAVKDLEAGLAAYLGVPHVVGCASGTEALQIAYMALGIGPGDEVITTPFTFVATVETLAVLGARPVFVDVDPRTYNLDPTAIEARVGPRTKAIVPVHLYGQPADMDPILDVAARRNLAVIEDTAQAIGAHYKGRRAGTIGTVGCLSFFPAKNLGCFGDGGALVTKDETVAKRCRLISNHGSDRRYHHEVLGLNSRLDTIQAAVLNAKLPHLESFNEGRIRVARAYDEGFADLDLTRPFVAPHVRHVYQQYSIRTGRRDALAEHLTRAGVPFAVHYPKPIHQQPAFAHFAEGQRFPVAEAVSREILSLPMFPEMTDTEIAQVIAAVRTFFKA